MKLIDTAQKLHLIEQVCFEQEPWSLSMFKSALENPNTVLVLEDFGYALGIKLSGESELHSIAVLPQFRGQGLGGFLLSRFLSECRAECGENPVFLEVASKNVPAIRLYERFGFVKIGVRKAYYKDDDAITMKRIDLSSESKRQV
ncbi:MAG: ribosomal protein S18-alanine N-acetyltransferase [Oscillospiraceae bacterium]|nr:ribosomal protein S18-alanine N-acetyltransferase [Oscillospiraceae bacterium]